MIIALEEYVVNGQGVEANGVAHTRPIYVNLWPLKPCPRS